MASYNEIGGVPAHVNASLLRRVLREEWGFRGFITSDRHSISQLVTRHRVAADNAEAARKTLECGVDFELQFDQAPCFEALPRLVREETLAEGLVDRAVARLLPVKFMLGLFENPFVEIVQLYIRDQVSSVTRPVQELKDFRRITLEPGETRKVEFAITPDKLVFFNEHMQRVVEPGLFDLLVGDSAAETQRVVLTVR
jgi:beta-glucosidase-like glycosyl hydrolase